MEMLYFTSFANAVVWCPMSQRKSRVGSHLFQPKLYLFIIMTRHERPDECIFSRGTWEHVTASLKQVVSLLVGQSSQVSCLTPKKVKLTTAIIFFSHCHVHHPELHYLNSYDVPGIVLHPSDSLRSICKRYTSIKRQPQHFNHRFCMPFSCKVMSSKPLFSVHQNRKLRRVMKDRFKHCVSQKGPSRALQWLYSQLGYLALQNLAARVDEQYHCWNCSFSAINTDFGYSRLHGNRR